MTRDVLVVDYGAGNLRSVSRALVVSGGKVSISGDPESIERASRIVLPGVGAFGHCADAIRERGLLEPIRRFASSGRPFLGICVGMQVLFEIGEEFGEHRGLGLMPGRVVAVPGTTSEGVPHKIPHIGWNRLLPAGSASWRGTVLEDVEPGSAVYFVHSFTARPEREEHRLAHSAYNGRPICAATRDGLIAGCQFHPEKSGPVGLAILSRFLRL